LNNQDKTDAATYAREPHPSAIGAQKPDGTSFVFPQDVAPLTGDPRTSRRKNKRLGDLRSPTAFFRIAAISGEGESKIDPGREHRPAPDTS